MLDEAGRYLQSAPISVSMAGFHSNTMALQQNGWQISVELIDHYQYSGKEQRIAFKHDGIKQVAIGRLFFDYRELTGPAHFLNKFKTMEIEISAIAPMIRVHELAVNRSMIFTPIDARPEIAKIKDLTDMALFKSIKTENFEIYINQKDEAEILEILLKKQDPKQKEIVQNNRRRKYLESDEAYQINDLSDKINTNVKHQLVLVG